MGCVALHSVSSLGTLTLTLTLTTQDPTFIIWKMRMIITEVQHRVFVLILVKSLEE